MTVALIVAGAFIAGFVSSAALAALAFHALTDIHREEQQAVIAERDQWRGERRELLNRIQHPHAMPTGSARPEPRARTAGEIARMQDWANVGRIVPGRRETDDPDPT